MKCPNCGKELAEDSKFCEFCGSKLNFATVSDISQEEVSHTSVESETESKGTITCPNCGKAIAHDSKFCEFCGAEIEADPKGKERGKIGLIIALSVICIIGIALFLTTTDVLKHAEFADEQIVVDSPEGEILIALTNRANYEMYVHPDWCSVEERKGNLYVKYADNYAPKDRRGDIAITSKGKNSKVEIFQKANKPSLLSTSSNSLKFSHNAGSNSISIKTDGAWLVSSEGLSDVNWLTAKKESDKLNVKVMENSESDRSCSIKLRAGEKTKIVTVMQNGNPSFLSKQLQQKSDMENGAQRQHSPIEKSRSKGATYLSTVPSSVKLLSNGGSEKITVKSDGDWTISTDNSQWYSLQRSGNTITLTIQQNYSTTPRSGYFDVKAGKLYKRFKVGQVGAATYLHITPSTYTFGCNGGEKAFKVNTDGEWRVISPLAGWGHLREDHTNNQVIVNVDNNCRGSKRDDYFVVSTGNKKEQGFIIQY